MKLLNNISTNVCSNDFISNDERVGRSSCDEKKQINFLLTGFELSSMYLGQVQSIRVKQALKLVSHSWLDYFIQEGGYSSRHCLNSGLVSFT